MQTAKILVFPGINREHDAADALRNVAGMKTEFVWHKDSDIGKADLIVIPGGFSYGDYLRCGAMAANSPIIRDLKAQAAKGVPILGICNGFQILVETRLLPGALLRNNGLKFICKHVFLKTEGAAPLFTSRLRAGEVLRVPVAHGEGNYFAAPDTLAHLNDNGLVAFRYCDAQGRVEQDANPNGSAENIAGIFSDNRRILGLMPHPENAIDPNHGGTDGKALFEGLATALLSS